MYRPQSRALVGIFIINTYHQSVRHSIRHLQLPEVSHIPTAHNETAAHAAYVWSAPELHHIIIIAINMQLSILYITDGLLQQITENLQPRWRTHRRQAMSGTTSRRPRSNTRISSATYSSPVTFHSKSSTT